MEKPQPHEYAAFYSNYIKSVPDEEDIISILERLKDSSYQFFNKLPEDKAGYAYAPGKWTIKQLLGHMIDAERVFAYRIQSFSRGDETPLPGFDENTYVEQATFDQRPLTNLADEFMALRQANLHLIKSLSEEQSRLNGTANGHKISVRALVYIMAGHEMHHLNIIKERYL